MEPDSENQLPPARRRPILITFVLVSAGLLLLNEAADSFHVHAMTLLLALQAVVGGACLVLALLCGTRRL